MDAPLWGDAGGHTGTAPTNLHHIFPHIPHKQNNHLRAIHSNETNRPTRNSSQTKSTVPHVICPNETVGANIRAQFSQAKCVGAAPACQPERPRSGVSIPKKVCVSRIMRGEFNDGCTLAGRHGRAHRHRPYPSPSYFSTQSYTNKIPSMRNSPQTKSTVHVQSAPTHLHANHAVCHYPIGVILSIAQGWQV